MNYYQLTGETIGNCGCSQSLACLCWDESESSGCGDSFVAYAITTGTIEGVDVSALNLVRIVRAEQQSIVYLDAKSTPEQQTRLIQAFGGELGGVLADLSAVLPAIGVPKLAPITYQIQANRRASLWIGNILVQRNLSRKPFSFAA